MKRAIILLSACSIVHHASAQTTLVLQPDAAVGEDAYVWSNNPDDNYGTNQDFNAVGWTWSGVPGAQRSVINFDLSSIPAGASINSASLSLYHNPDSGLIPFTGGHSQLSGSNQSVLQRITSAWSESTVDWNTQPTTTSTNQVVLAASSSSTEDYLNIDVTAMVQDMIDNPATSFGFMYQLTDENYYRAMLFASSDHANAALHPKLEINYIAVGIDDLVDKPKGVSVYPNPAANQVTVSYDLADLSGGFISIHNAAGEEILDLTPENNKTTQIDVSLLSAGVYFVRVGNRNSLLPPARLVVR